MILLLFVFLCVHSLSTPIPEQIGKFEVPVPAFLYLNSLGEGENQRDSLFITTFSGNPFAKDTIYFVDYFEQAFQDFDKIQPEVFTKKVVWPNEALSAPYELFNATVIVACGGFLPPGKTPGTIYLFDLKNNVTNKISTDKTKYFYSQTKWFDVDGDGYEDILTARAIEPTFGASSGELIYYKNPGPEKAFDGAWQYKVLVEGPDVSFVLYDIDGDGYPEILTAQYFSTPGFWVYWADSWNDPNTIESRQIDGTVSTSFDLEVTDLNNDGKNDVLFTNHVNNASLSGAYAYEIPQDYKTASWPKHTLVTNITTIEKGVGQASPGAGFSYYPYSNQTNEKPHIFLSGDGAEKAWILSAVSQSPSNWQYQQHLLIDVGGTTGQPLTADVNHDGRTELYLPDYNNNLVWAWTY